MFLPNPVPFAASMMIFEGVPSAFQSLGGHLINFLSQTLFHRLEANFEQVPMCKQDLDQVCAALRFKFDRSIQGTWCDQFVQEHI